mmetsp:Transcript_18075/g.68539  ORF Transcript_18075/g.68539 Transcript_18075/m.68539 type:complete len:206 (-) Transcript_18075:846-1463(-)
MFQHWSFMTVLGGCICTSCRSYSSANCRSSAVATSIWTSSSRPLNLLTMWCSLPTLAYRSGPPTLSWNLMLSPDSLMPSSSMLVCSFSKVSSGSTAVGSTAGLLSNCLHRYEKSDFPWYAARTWTKGETNHARGRGAGDKAHMVDSKSLRSGMVFDFGPSKIFLLDASSFVRTENLLSDLPNCPAVDAESPKSAAIRRLLAAPDL